MKSTIVLAAVLAVAAAQFPGFVPARVPQYVRPTFAPPTPPPYRVSTISPVVSVNRAVSNDAAASIVRYDNDVNPDGSYAYAYETDNGISAQEQGTPREYNSNPPVRPVIAQGSFAYTSPEGIPIVISYIADENGFQPTGESIPTSPPIPEAILRSLEYNAKFAPQVQKK